MKVLVTGASGFLGNYIISNLLDKGYDVTATSTSLDNIKYKSWFNKVKFIEFNLNNFQPEKNYFKYFNQPEILIHLAWESLPDFNNLIHIEKNLPVQYMFLKNMIQNGLDNLTVSGTCLEYGLQEGCLTESDSLFPVTAYGTAKSSLYNFLNILKKSYQFSFKWPRIFYIYGKGQHSKSLYVQMNQAIIENRKVFNMSMGDQLRDFIPVEKAADYIVAISTQKIIEGPINCCSGKPVAVFDFVTRYFEEKNYKISLNRGFYPYPEYEPKNFWGDNSLLKKIIINE